MGFSGRCKRCRRKRRIDVVNDGNNNDNDVDNNDDNDDDGVSNKAMHQKQQTWDAIAAFFMKISCLPIFFRNARAVISFLKIVPHSMAPNVLFE